MNSDIPKPVRCSSLKHIHQFPNPIQINPITNSLQIFKNRLKCQNTKPHRSSSKTRHSHISTHINNKSITGITLHLLQNLLNRHWNVRLPKGFSFKHPNNVLMGFIRQISQICNREQKRVSNSFHNVGNHRVGLRAFEAIERGNWSKWEMGFDCEIRSGLMWRAGVVEEEEEDDEDGERKEKEEWNRGK